ncbi:MAG: hypothetical protein HAW59_04650, partial [Betaproteobacteria bacterium]|nr:hypothetical protein [Betaproteobacteria bacterium]
RIAFEWELGGGQNLAARRTNRFSVKDWFFAPVEREFTQRIRKGGPRRTGGPLYVVNAVSGNARVATAGTIIVLMANTPITISGNSAFPATIFTDNSTVDLTYTSNAASGSVQIGSTVILQPDKEPFPYMRLLDGNISVTVALQSRQPVIVEATTSFLTARISGGGFINLDYARATPASVSLDFSGIVSVAVAGADPVVATVSGAAGVISYGGGALSVSVVSDGVRVGTVELDCAEPSPDMTKFSVNCPLAIEFLDENGNIVPLGSSVQSDTFDSGTIVSIRTEGGDLNNHVPSLLNPPAELTNGGIRITDKNIVYTSRFTAVTQNTVLLITVQLTDGMDTVSAIYPLRIAPPDLALVVGATEFGVLAGRATALVTATARGGDGSYTFRLEGAPNNLAINAGIISITAPFLDPTTLSFVVVVEDGGGAAERATLTLEILEGLALALTPSSANVPVGAGNIPLAQAQGRGGEAPYTYEFGAGALGNVEIDSAGGAIRINTEFAAAATHNIEIIVQDAAGMRATTVLELSVFLPLALAIDRTSANAQVGRADVLFADATASGGIPPYTYTFGGGAPGNITINSTNGDIGVGTAFLAAATHNIEIIAADSSTPPMRATLTLALRVSEGLAASVNPSSATATVGETSSSSALATVMGIGGVERQAGAPYLYRLGTGAPDNLAINAGGAVFITGAFTAAAARDIEFVVEDADGALATATLALEIVNPPLVLTVTPPLAVVRAGAAVVLATAAASGGDGNYTYRLASGAPSEVAIDSGSGAISVATAFTAAAADLEVVIIVSDGDGAAATVTLGLTVAEGLVAMFAPSSAVITVNETAQNLSALQVAGVEPYTYSVVAGAPSEVSVDGNGVLNVNTAFSATATHTIQVAVTDSDTPPSTVTAALELAVVYPALE